MFGYVLPDKPELKVKDYELFRAYYCGVCKAIGKIHGQKSRLTLNYDTTFLAIMLSMIADEEVSIKRQRCIAHPLNKRNMIRKSEIINYAADMNVLLAYYKLLDNWKDEKSIFSGTASIVLKKSFRKIYKKHREKCDIIKKKLDELSQLEKGKCESMDMAAEPFAKIIEEIICYENIINEEKNKKVIKWIGYNLGKWIYILDSYDDLEKDIKSGSYNPLLCQFNYNGEEVKEFKLKIRERVNFNLTHSLSQIAQAYELLSVKSGKKEICLDNCNNYSGKPDVSAIVQNVIFLGMLKKTEQILQIRSSEELEKSV